MGIKKIPTGEQSLLCASVFTNNFKRVIEELMYNSLDAGSSSVAIRVSLQDHFIQVLDNGNGISKDNFSLLGQKYATSKYVDIITLKSASDKYGFRGLSLASIIDVSQSVKISSRHENSNDTWHKTFYNGKEKEICKTIPRPSKGTTVEIKGFLYNLNMKRKLLDPHTEMENVKTALQQLSLVHYNVSISLRDDSKNDIILQIHKNRTFYDTLQSLFQINEKDVQELQVEKNKYKVRAFIGKNTVESNNKYQWIYINGKFIHKSILHNKLNKILSKHGTKNYGKTSKSHAHEDENILLDSKGPFYFIFIKCPNYDFDMTYNSEKSLIEFKDWKEVDKLIEKLVQFYSGGLASKIKAIHKINNNEKKSSTRLEIKQIIDKILNNENKQSIIEHQNGINGKIQKRNLNKKKKLSTKKVLSKITETNDLLQTRIYSKPSYVNKSKEHLNLQPVGSKTPKDAIMISNCIKNKTPSPKVPEKNKKKEFQISKKQVKKKLTMTFKPPTKTFIKRCKRIHSQAHNFLNKKGFKQYCPYENTLNYETLSLIKKSNKDLKEDNKWNNFDYGMVKKSYDLLKAIVTSQNDMTKNNKIVNKSNQMVKRSYDLLKAVKINNQCHMMENKNNDLNYRKQTYKSKTNYTYEFNKANIPTTTYNSHINYNYEIKRMGCFISETSRNNFFSKEQNSQASNKVKYPKINQKIRKTTLFNKISDQVQQKSSYTIEITDNHKVVNSTSDTIQDEDLKLKDDSHTYHTKSIHFENTFTLEGFVRSSQNNDETNLNETYLSKMCHALRACNLGELRTSIMQDIAEYEKSNFIVPESESDDAETMHNIVAPVNYCEIVLHSQCSELRQLEKEFEHSFFNKRREFSHNTVQNENICNEDNFNKSNLCEISGNFERNRHCNFFSLNYNDYNVVNNYVECVDDELDKNQKNAGPSKNLNQEALQFMTYNYNIINDDPMYDFQLKSRYRFMPKGMSPITNNGYKLQNLHTLNRGEEYYEDMIYKNFADDVLLNTETYEPEVQNVKHQTQNVELQKHDTDLIFDSISLTQAKILGQVDRKFIVSTLNGRSVQTGISSEFLVLFDQHAVDERIRLENNLSDYMEDGRWKSTVIDPVPIVLKNDEHLYFINHTDKLARFGLQWAFTLENKIFLHAIPTAIIGKNQRQVEIVMRAAKKLISEQIQSLKSLRGNISMYPKSIMELVFSEACRYAIKFGDKLSKTECINMINALAGCKTPFQCAHGRPVMAVLMELRNKSPSYKVNLSKVKKSIKMP